MRAIGHFLTRHRTILFGLHRLFHRPRVMEACFICRAVWAEYDTPGLRATYEQAMADYAAGRYYRRNEAGEWVRNPGWTEETNLTVGPTDTNTTVNA